MSQYLWINLITNRAESLSKLVLGQMKGKKYYA